MLVLQGAAPGAAAGRRVVMMGLVVELAGQRLRGPAVRGDGCGGSVCCSGGSGALPRYSYTQRRRTAFLAVWCAC